MTPNLSRIKPARTDQRFPYLHKKERRYLAGRKIKTIEQLADRCDQDVLGFKGCGPDSVKRLTRLLTEHGARFLTVAEVMKICIDKARSTFRRGFAETQKRRTYSLTAMIFGKTA